tara:strand:+ start:15477 stop:18611 length:3135 start_codon:yes stop_codon:yes gene_type:complete
VNNLTRLLGITDKEWRRCLSMALLFFLLMVGWGFGRAGRDAFFIVEAGPEKLPYMYIINAILMVVFSAIYAKVVDRLNRHTFLIYQLILFSVAVISLRILVPFRFGWMPYAIFSLSEVITLFYFMHFWTYANDIFDPREGKRIFPLIGGAGLMGNVLGSTFTKPVVELTGTVDLLLVWVATMIVSIPATLYVNRTAEAAGIGPTESGEEEQLSFRESVASVWSIKLIRTLTFISLPMWLTIYFVDFQFFLAMDEVFTDQDALSGFLGVFNGITSLLGFAIQMFITTRLIKRFGVGTAVLAHPISVTLGSVGLVIRSFLPMAAARLFSFRGLSAVFAKFSDNALFYSVGESATQLLYNAVPEEKRGQSRAFVAGTVEPLFTAVAGIALIVFTAFALPIQVLAIITLVVSIAWVFLVRKVKDDYVSALVKNLCSLDIDIQSAAFAELSRHTDSNSIEILIEAAKSPDFVVARFALDLIRNSGRNEETTMVLNDLSTYDDEILPYVIETLSAMGDVDLNSAVKPFLNSSDSDIRCASIRALTAAKSIQDYHLLRPFLTDPVLTVREEVVGSFYLSGDDKLTSLARNVLSKMTESNQKPDVIAAIRIMGKTGDLSFISRLETLLASSDRSVVKAAVESLGRLPASEAALCLVPLLDDSTIGPAVEASLVRIGSLAQYELLKNVNGDISVSWASLRCLTEIRMQSSINDFPASDALESVVSFLTDECTRLQEMITCDGMLGNLEEHQAVTLLRDALSEEAKATEEGLLNCLQLLADQETVRAGITSLRSGVARTMAEGLEVLEESCPHGREVARILEKIHFPTNDIKTQTTLHEVISQMLVILSVEWTKACAIYLAGEMRLNGLTVIEEFANSDFVWLRENGRLAMKKNQKNDQLTEEEKRMALNMERMLFLRSVPLFRNLSGSDLAIVNDIAVEKSFNKDDLVVEEGSVGDALYIILAGNMRVVKGKDDSTTLALLQERETFGEMAILDDEPRSATVEAQTDVRLLEIRQADFQRLLIARPQIALALFRTLSHRLRKTGEKLVSAESP